VASVRSSLPSYFIFPDADQRVGMPYTRGPLTMSRYCSLRQYNGNLSKGCLGWLDSGSMAVFRRQESSTSIQAESGVAQDFRSSRYASRLLGQRVQDHNAL
jgi:hypothetical protein